MSKFLDEKGLRQLIELIRNLNSEGDSEGMMLSAGNGIYIDSEGRIHVRVDEDTIKINSEGAIETILPLPEVSAADEGKILKVVNGKWDVVNAQPVTWPCVMLDVSGETSPYGDIGLINDIRDKIGDYSSVIECYELALAPDTAIDYDTVISLLHKGDSFIVFPWGMAAILGDTGKRKLPWLVPTVDYDTIGNITSLPEGGTMYFCDWIYNDKHRLLYIDVL